MNRLLDFDISIRNSNTEIIASRDNKYVDRTTVDNSRVKDIVTKICNSRELDSDKLIRMCKVFKIHKIKVRSKE